MRSGFIFFFISLFTLSSFAKVNSSQRALIVISQLDTNGLPDLESLYRSLEKLTTLSVDRILDDSYRKIIYLTNNDATLENFFEESYQISLDSRIKAIDVILSVHGNPSKLHFANRAWSMEKLENAFSKFTSSKTELEISNLKRKLRVMYNLSCYGKTHNETFLNLGFDVSTGSVKVNANSEVEFIPMLKNWKRGDGLKESFNFSNSETALTIADGPIRTLGRIQNSSALQNVNSKKVFLGRVNLTIESDPL